ncbi:hypothetical protein GRI69_08600 [Erythrobacter vulgaris]|uniref:Peptidase metallopeptidase domain-containing protein n=1 Tax=Qipengyuania vulgaris TaxID=291985 RepID=A0A844XSD0_9SPHN|nr:calcium-binding protein [Qipengyuania vulgaris]MXO48314.1 hypothetical protein [Qipengyuania vulgaris]
MALNPIYTIANTAQISEDVIELLLGVTDEALRLWGEVLAGNANVRVHLVLLESNAEGRAAATWGNSVNLGQLDNGTNLIVGGAAHALQTGQNSEDGWDIYIEISRDYLLNELFLDPTPTQRGDVPSDRTDGLSVMLHEIGHALGFNGYGGGGYQFFQSAYDLRRTDIEGQEHFLGPNVERVFGGPVELTTGNSAHYGNSSEFPGENDNPILGLMNGVTYYRGYTYEISDLDLAFLADTGLGTILDDVLDVPLHDFLRGGAGNDRVLGGEIVNHLFGDEGNDYLSRSGGDDELFGGTGADELFGGEGNDLIDGGAGIDIASYADASSGVRVTLGAPAIPQDTMGAGNDMLISIETLHGSAFSDQLFGGSGVDTLHGNAGNDEIHGSGGSDKIYGGTGNDLLIGGAGWDTISGGGWSDSLFGYNGNDRLYGDFGNDMLDGGGNHDLLIGGGGSDTLIGGWGKDVLTGGADADIFKFKGGHTGKWQGNADIITDFSQGDGDLIDLSAIDAISGGSDDAFSFVGDAAFSGTAGELRSYSSGGHTYLAADMNGDGAADLQIRLDGDIVLTSMDFVL